MRKKNNPQEGVWGEKTAAVSINVGCGHSKSKENIIKLPVPQNNFDLHGKQKCYNSQVVAEQLQVSMFAFSCSI